MTNYYKLKSIFQCNYKPLNFFSQAQALPVISSRLYFADQLIVSIVCLPSAYIDEEEIQRLCKAIESLVQCLKSRKLYQLLLHLMEEDTFSDKADAMEGNYFYQGMDTPQKGAVSV